MTDESVTSERRPFLGTRWFNLSDTALFFGRDQEKDQIASRLMSNRPVFVHGPSGAGKTSILFAGVIPTVKEQLARFSLDRAVVVVAARDWRADYPLKHVLWGVLLPGGDLPRELALLPQSSRSLEHAGGMALSAASAFIADTTLPPLLLFVLDQLEDLWPRGDEDFTKRSQLPDVRQSLARVVQLVRKRPSGGKAPVNVALEPFNQLPEDVEIALVGGIRQDCLSLLNRLNEEVAISFDDLYELPLLDCEAAKMAIELPLLKVGFSISKSSVQHLVEDLSKLTIHESLTSIKPEIGSAPVSTSNLSRSLDPEETPDKLADLPNPIEPLLLQIVMERLHEEASKKSNSSTRTIVYPGTTTGAQRVLDIATKYFEECIEKVDPSLQRIRDLSFASLVSSQGRPIAKSADEIYDELVQRGEKKVSKKNVSRVLIALTEQRILRLLSSVSGNEHASTDRYELFHGLFATLARYRSEVLINDDLIRARKMNFLSTMFMVAGFLVLVAMLVASYFYSAELKNENQIVKDENQIVKDENQKVKDQVAILRGTRDRLKADAEAYTKTINDHRLAAKQAEIEKGKLYSLMQRKTAPYIIYESFPDENSWDTGISFGETRRLRSDLRKSFASDFDKSARNHSEKNSMFQFDEDTATKPGLFSVIPERYGSIPKGQSAPNCNYKIVINPKSWPEIYGPLGRRFTYTTWGWDLQGYFKEPFNHPNVNADAIQSDRSFKAPNCHKNVYTLIQPSNEDSKTVLFKVDLCGLARQSPDSEETKCKFDGA